MLIPTKRLASQKRIPKPLERDERVPPTLSFGQRGAKLLHACIHVRRKYRLLEVFVFFAQHWRALLPEAHGSLAVGYAFKINPDFIFLGRPGVGKRIAPHAPPIFAAQFDDSLI